MKIPEGYEVQIFDNCYLTNPKLYYGPREISSFPEMNNKIESMVIRKLSTVAPVQICCKAMNKACLACSHGITEDEFCEANPGQYDCPEIEIVPQVLFYTDKNL